MQIDCQGRIVIHFRYSETGSKSDFEHVSKKGSDWIIDNIERHICEILTDELDLCIDKIGIDGFNYEMLPREKKHEKE